jgi:hypothetical protein
MITRVIDLIDLLEWKRADWLKFFHYEVSWLHVVDLWLGNFNSEITRHWILLAAVPNCIDSAVAFSKSKLRNRLNEHLSTYVGIFSQNFYTLENFPFDKVYDEWHVDRMRQPDC